jgi:hypothetical protein
MSPGYVEWNERRFEYGNCADCGQPINDDACFSLDGLQSARSRVRVPSLLFHKHCLRRLADDLAHDLNKQVIR